MLKNRPHKTKTKPKTLSLKLEKTRVSGQRDPRDTSSVLLARRKGKGLAIPKLIKDNFYRETQ
jgi:hypothetical protein